MEDIKQELKEIKYLDFKINSSIEELERLKFYQDLWIRFKILIQAICLMQ